MTARRQELLDKLEAAAATAMPERLADDCRAICFQILYALPPELQIRAASSMLQRYLPIFEKKQPSLTWARRILEDPDGWNGPVWSRVKPDYPDGADSADTDYCGAFGPFFNARQYKVDPVRLAANASDTMADVAQARARNVWLADDPEAARIEREEDAFYAVWRELPPEEQTDPPTHFKELESPAHGRYYNAAFIAVYRREWAIVAAWFRAEAVWQYPEPEDLDAMMQALAQWQARNFLPMGATWEELGYPPDYNPE